MLLVPIYIVSSVSFILGLKMLSHPATARNGNLAAAAGMALAIFATIFMYIDPETGQGLNNYGWIFSGLILGSIVGTLAAKRVQMTAMPEMVSLFNGMGGACAALISLIEYQHLSHLDITSISGQKGMILIIVLGLIIGSVSFAGSMIAYGKLNGKIGDFSFKGQNILSIILLLIIIGLAVSLVMDPGQPMLFYVIFVLSLLYGAFFVFPIGGADMPVVISLLNSFTGVAAAFGGFLYDNKVMLTGGILVGAAGTLLTILMCKAMNRSLLNVLIGNFGGNASSSGGTSEMGSYKEVSLSDAAVQMAYANRVIIVPGYGLLWPRPQLPSGFGPPAKAKTL